MKRLVMATVFAIAGAGVATPPASAASTTDTVWLTFDNGTNGAPLSTVQNRGTTGSAVGVSVVTSGGGSLLRASSFAGNGGAGSPPTLDAARTGKRAVVRVTNATTVDRMNPGNVDFYWGADFALNAANYSMSTGSADNGNNLLQRGLYADRAQFKAEVDGNQPICRVKGSAGQLALGVGFPVDTRSATSTPWYRMRCLKSSSSLTIQVARFNADGKLGAYTSRTVTGPVGSLDYTRTVPMAVGGKLNADGSIVLDAADQFNGLIDNVSVGPR